MNFQTRVTLMNRLKNSGDDKDWEEFNEIYRKFIYGVLKKSNIEEHLREDVIQDVLLSVWKVLPGFEYNPQKGRFSSWVAKITLNRAYSVIQQKNSRQNRDQKYFDNTDQKLDNEVEEIINSEWNSFLIQTAWESLSPTLSESMRKVFEAYMRNPKIVDIAKELDMPSNTVAVYKQRVATLMKREIHRLNENLN